MASINETPRQKMIGILYLVLLGMIALNVSTSVLDAFKTLTSSLQTSTKNVQGNIDNNFAAFESTKLQSEPERARPIYERAKLARKYADDLDGYIVAIKNLMIENGGGYDSKTGDVKKRDNQDIAYRLMINQGRGRKLKDTINAT